MVVGIVTEAKPNIFEIRDKERKGTHYTVSFGKESNKKLYALWNQWGKSPGAKGANVVVTMTVPGLQSGNYGEAVLKKVEIVPTKPI